MLFKQPWNDARDDEDDTAPIWSPAIKDALDDWYTAKHEHDEEGLKSAARSIVDATAAYHKAGGVPLFAHLPLPPQFVEAELGDVNALHDPHAARVINAFIDKFDDAAKPIVSQQAAMLLKGRESTPLMTVQNTESMEPEIDVRHAPSLLELTAKASTPPGGPPDDQDNESAVRSPYGESPRQQRGPQPPLRPGRIVKAYRKYQTPGMGPDDLELKEAQKLADDADYWCGLTSSAVDQSKSLNTQPDFRVRQFLDVMHRYFRPGSDKAFVVVGAADPEMSMNNHDRFASYDPRTDRFYFTKDFLSLSARDKIITIIHEALHATQWVRAKEAAMGYDRKDTPKRVRDEHEAELDRIAVSYAKMLGY